MPAQPPIHSHEPIRLLWIGDAAEAIAHFTRRAPHVRVTPSDAASMVGALQGGGADLIVLDATQDGIDVSAVLGHLQTAQLDTPVLLLTRAGGEDLAIQAGRFAVCDCVVKTADYLLQVLPAIGQLRARHDLAALYRTNRQGQDRLRTILEFQPAVTSVINPEGIVTAMNQAGLMLLGAARDQVVGRPFAALVPDEGRADAADFIRRVCQGESADFDHVVVRGGLPPLAVRTRAVPFRNGDSVVALATVQVRLAAPLAANAELEAASAAALANALGEIESLRTERDRWNAQRETYELRAREAAAHADAVMQQAQADASMLVKERAEWALERQQHAQHRREAETVAADLAQATAALQHVHAELAQAQAALAPLRQAQEAFDTLREDFAPLRAELDTLRAERGQWLTEHATLSAERDQRHAEREQWLSERAQLEARLADIGQSDALRRQLEDERDSLTRVLHAVTGRCDLLEAEAKRAEAAATEAIERQRQDAAVLAQLDAERATLAQALASAQAQVSDAATALGHERLAWTQEREAAATQHQQELDLLHRAIAQERQHAQVAAAESDTLRHAAEADRGAMLKLRDDLLRFMADADSQCRRIIEQHEARLTPGALDEQSVP